MKFALVNNARTEAIKGVKGYCPFCGSELIPRCGSIKIHHWAHKSKLNCDHYWETETLWHRFWKNNYPSEWQEKIFFDDQTGEKHIADVFTDYNLVLEFQHSHIDPQERIARERFYKNMTWVIDGTRLKRDYPRFLKEVLNFCPFDKSDTFFVDNPAKCFPSTWLGSTVPVVFDFLGADACRDLFDERSHLYCLLPFKMDESAILIRMDRDIFIKLTRNSVWMLFILEWEEKLKAREKNKQILEMNRLRFSHTRKRKGSPLVFERGKWRKRYPRL